LSASGTLNARLGAETAFAVTLLAGVVLLFLGFLVTTSATVFRTSASARAEAGSQAAVRSDLPQHSPEHLAGQALR
jgi:hypothetical protein